MIEAFLREAGWAACGSEPLAQDASSRQYRRLVKASGSAVLMQAPVRNTAERASFAAFRKIGTHLRGLGLSAPKEIAADPDNGLLLLEDLGDLSLSSLLASDATLARRAYAEVAALLPVLKAAPPEGLARPGPQQLAELTRLTLEQLSAPTPLADQLIAGLTATLSEFTDQPPVLSLRDLHGDNLMWLPDRDGVARIGLLDFQDALLLPDGYDLASLLDDPRRVVPEAWRTELVASASVPERQINALSVQRNLRILGIFRRLSTQMGKPAYARFIPRTRDCISRLLPDFPDLAEPVGQILAETKSWSEAA